MKRVLMLIAATLPWLAGCSLVASDTVPPAPGLVGVQAQDAAWADQIKRAPDSDTPTFRPLAQAREAVEAARGQTGVRKHDAESLDQAEQALADATAAWDELTGQRRRQPDRLAAIARDAHRAQRFAEIARYTAVRESNLKELVALDDQLRRRRPAAEAAARGLVGQKVIPERLGGVRFESGTARLTQSSRTVVTRLADLMGDNPRYGVAIFGHTDNAAPPDASLNAFVDANPGLEKQAPSRDDKVRAFNLALSSARARAVAQLLVDNGVSARRIGARGFGGSRPVASNSTARGRKANRRIVAVIVPGPDSQNTSIDRSGADEH